MLNGLHYLLQSIRARTCNIGAITGLTHRTKPLRRFGALLSRTVTTLGLGLGGAAWAACPSEGAALEQVLPGVAVRHGHWPGSAPDSTPHWASSVVLWHNRQATVIDPGPTRCNGQQLDQAIRSLAPAQHLRVTQLINTHAHAEQVLANSAWPVPVAATATTQASMQRRCPDCLASLRHDLGTDALQGTRIVWPRQVLREGDTLQAGGRHWLALEMRMAHTESDLVLWSPQDRVALVGGLIDGHQLVLAQGRIVGWLQALDRLQALPIDWLIGQHRVARPGEVPDTLQAQREALCALARFSWQGLEDGLTEAEALARWPMQATQDEARQRQSRFNLMRAWREMEERWLAHEVLPAACTSAPHTP